MTTDAQDSTQDPTLDALGVEITVSRGTDGQPVVFVDTTAELDAPDGPAIRIRLNDEIVYGGRA
jgi:hypothetical protein